MKQPENARRMGTKQSAVARFEDCNYGGWKVGTLKRVARALGVRLAVGFEGFDNFDEDFNRESLQRPEFGKDER